MANSVGSDQLYFCITMRNYKLPCSYSRTESGMSVFQSFHAHAYLSQVRIKYGTLLRLVSKYTRLVAGYLATHCFSSGCLFTRLPLLVSVPVSSLKCYAKNITKTLRRENLHILLIPIPVSNLSILTEVHSLPIYGIISRCLIDRIQVAFDDAINTS